MTDNISILSDSFLMTTTRCSIKLPLVNNMILECPMNDESGLSKNRLETLTDGIFAVAMILVLNINVPEISAY